MNFFLYPFSNDLDGLDVSEDSDNDNTEKLKPAVPGA
jgi:hypothetical protein